MAHTGTHMLTDEQLDEVRRKAATAERERLAKLAVNFDLEMGVELGLHGVDQANPMIGFADWLRAQGGDNE